MELLAIAKVANDMNFVVIARAQPSNFFDVFTTQKPNNYSVSLKGPHIMLSTL